MQMASAFHHSYMFYEKWAVHGDPTSRHISPPTSLSIGAQRSLLQALSLAFTFHRPTSSTSVMAISGQAIATLIIFIISIVFVIYPVSFPVTLPYLGRKRIYINLTTAPIVAILVLWAAQCLGPRVVSAILAGESSGRACTKHDECLDTRWNRVGCSSS